MLIGQVVKLENTLALGANAERLEGSIPSLPTKERFIGALFLK